MNTAKTNEKCTETGSEWCAPLFCKNGDCIWNLAKPSNIGSRSFCSPLTAEAEAAYRRRFFPPVFEPPLLSPPTLRLGAGLVKSWAGCASLLSTLGSNVCIPPSPGAG
eukprot:COSAG02_NODE_276_length_26189_cov_810.678191_17_plen_108_part_00